MSKGTASKTLDTIKWLVSLAIFTVAIVGNSYFVEVAFLYKVLV
jgi:preprotein translocase subunit SecE